MSIIVTQRCVSTDPWFEIKVSSATEKDKEYRILVPWPDDEVDDLTCECLSFVHRGWCHHQEEAFDSLCRWASIQGPEEQTRDQRHNHICPRCGNETISEAEFE
jgi:hypothetical protein